VVEVAAGAVVDVGAEVVVGAGSMPPTEVAGAEVLEAAGWVVGAEVGGGEVAGPAGVVVVVAGWARAEGAAVVDGAEVTDVGVVGEAVELG
jgi:hypothetical protein